MAAENFSEDHRRSDAVPPSPEEMLQESEGQNEYAEPESFEQDRDDQRFVVISIAQFHVAADDDHLGEHECFENGVSIMKKTDVVLGQDEALVACQRTEAQREVGENPEHGPDLAP